jgi:3-deoxy-D-manno-octulosonate 8-phosphate phosphatase (KDO 8-P phosphatase)
MNPTPWPAEPISLLLLDVDGTLTDGGLYYGAEGMVMKRFDVRDGFGIVRLREAGVEVAIVSADHSPIIAARCERLGLGRPEMGCREKGEAVRAILAARGLEPRQVCYMGDDLLDLPAFAAVGHTAAPAEAVAEVRAAAEYVTVASGGHGAVREVCDLILAARK